MQPFEYNAPAYILENNINKCIWNKISHQAQLRPSEATNQSSSSDGADAFFIFFFTEWGETPVVDFAMLWQQKSSSYQINKKQQQI